MAWAFVAHRGAGTNKAGAGTISVNPLANLVVGAIIILRGVSDNISGNGASTDHGFSDSKGNSWTRIIEHTRSPGGVGNDGVTLSLWISQITIQINTTDTITFTWPGTAAGMSIMELSVGAGNGYSIAGSAAATGTSGTPSVTLSGLSSTTYEWIGSLGVEGPNTDAFTQDVDYANNQNNGTTGGAADTNVAQRIGTRNFLGTSDTYNPTCTSRDWVCLLTALLETTPPAAGVKILTLTSAGS